MRNDPRSRSLVRAAFLTIAVSSCVKEGTYLQGSVDQQKLMAAVLHHLTRICVRSLP